MVEVLGAAGMSPNDARRHETEYQRVRYGERLEAAIAEDARMRMSLAAAKGRDNCPYPIPNTGRTRDEVANLVGLGSGKTYERHALPPFRKIFRNGARPATRWPGWSASVPAGIGIVSNTLVFATDSERRSGDGSTRCLLSRNPSRNHRLTRCPPRRV
jgi:hypothetical protein